MGERGETRRRLIVSRAHGVFVARGFSAVTMGDVVDACGISRGNLYMYFSSTEEIFLAVLASGREQEENQIDTAMRAGVPAAQIATEFLRGQEEELLHIDTTLRRASYEYWMSRPSEQGARIAEMFDAATSTVARLLEYGHEPGAQDHRDVARQVVLWLEGLSVLAVMTEISAELVRGQLAMVATVMGVVR